MNTIQRFFAIWLTMTLSMYVGRYVGKWVSFLQARKGQNQRRITATRAPQSSAALKTRGIIMIVAGFMFQIWATVPEEVLAIRVPLGLLGVLISCWGAFLYWRGRQYTAETDAERILTDLSPDVLYLRAFRSDASTAEYVSSAVFMPAASGET